MENYTGPYWSDGKLQSSVEFGKSAPLSALDAESRLHDSAYAHYNDVSHRMAADAIYEEHVSKLGGFAKFAGETVLYGNQTLRAGSNLLEYSKYGPLGLIAGALINDYYLFDYMNNSDRYKKEVLAYYATDPGWDQDQTKQGEVRQTRRFATGENDSFAEVKQTLSPGNVNHDRRHGNVLEYNYGYSRDDYSREYAYNPYNSNGGGRRRKRRIRYD